jgi:hypothetical protein
MAVLGAVMQPNRIIRIDEKEAVLGATEIYCDNCHCYRPLEQEPWHRDGAHEFSDQICSVCRWICATLRRPATPEPST